MLDARVRGWLGQVVQADDEYDRRHRRSNCGHLRIRQERARENWREALMFTAECVTMIARQKASGFVSWSWIRPE